MNDLLDETASNENLMARFGRGDSRAFEILVRRHQRSVLNFIYRFIGDRIEAEDLAQEVFLKAWQSAAAYKPTAKFTTWIYRIAANLCINKQKYNRIRRLFMVSPSRKEEEALGDEFYADHAGKSPSPEDLLLVAERRRQILNAIQQLPANQRMALVLKRYDDLSYKEISKIMDLSVSAVDSLVVRAKRNLRGKLVSLEKKSQGFPR
jgi:RNA polymerase sigma-70 factor, ECF subfamily